MRSTCERYQAWRNNEDDEAPELNPDYNEGECVFYEPKRYFAGVITFGPKNNFSWCVPVCYTPTPEQIKNLQEVFGFDYMSNEELEQDGG